MFDGMRIRYYGIRFKSNAMVHVVEDMLNLTVTQAMHFSAMSSPSYPAWITKDSNLFIENFIEG